MMDAQAIDETDIPDIYGSLTVFDIDKSPPYYPLSYEWGSDQDLATIRADGSQFEVRRNLYDFFETMRGMRQRLPFESTDHCYLWVDQICINQSDVQERNNQVSIMRIIYTLATTVIAWLGLHANLDDTSVVPTRACDLRNDSLDDRRKFVVRTKLASSGYWDRLWVVQELILAKEVVVTLGRQCWLFDSLYPYDVPPQDSDYITGIRHLSSRVLSIEDTLRAQKQMHTGSAILSLASAVLRYGRKQCSDPRDKLYALLSIVHIKGSISTDYNLNPLEVFALAVKVVLIDAVTSMNLECVKFPDRLEVFEREMLTVRRCLIVLGSEMGLAKEAVARHVLAALDDSRRDLMESITTV